MVRGLTSQPHPFPVPREPVLPSIDESNPIYYNKLHLPLPTPAPPPNSPHFPILLWSTTSCPLPAVLVLAWGWGLQRVGALLLQVDVFCRTGVLHKLLVELVKCTPGKWGIAGDQGLNPGSPKGALGFRDSAGLCSEQSSPGEDSLVERAQQLTNREVPQTLGFSGPPSLFQDRVTVALHRRKCQGCDRHVTWADLTNTHTHPTDSARALVESSDTKTWQANR